MDNVVYAGIWRRILATTIDTLILWIPASLFGWSGLFIGVNEIAYQLLDFTYLAILWAGYYGFMESSQRQATFGKQVIGILVVDYEGKRISFLNAIGRYFGMFIAVLPLCLGLLMIGWTKKKQGLHDMLARCLVIRGKV